MTDTEKEKLNRGEVLPLMEEFYTIQGEGFHSGKAAYFIRVGGCDVGCHWCDVKESWDASLHPPTSADLIIEHANAFPARAVVITGGEPAMYSMEYLTKGLHKKGIKTFLETSGAYPISGIWDWVCLSPKKTMPPLEESLRKADELKVIIYNKNDFQWAETHATKVKPGCILYLQPEWSKSAQIMQDLVDYVLEHPNWNISLQTHKYMHIP
ncbi:MAG: 7-carboxy-7-deazaguanine synthase QueE [Bacteroidia bacterium]